MVARLELAATLSAVDDAALYQHCCLFAETEAIRASRQQNARLVTRLLATINSRLSGEDVVEAITQIAKLKQLEAKQTTQLRQGHMAIRQYLVEFGMTPAARSRVTPAAEAAAANPLDRYTKARA